MRKLLTAVAIAACVAGITIASGQAARADSTLCDNSGGVNTCEVWQNTAAGQALAAASYDTDSGNAWGYVSNRSGFSLNVWVQQNTGDGYATVWGPYGISSSGGALRSPSFFDGTYLTRTCFQFTSWSGAAVHCTAGV
jgi:hypothetical protein